MSEQNKGEGKRNATLADSLELGAINAEISGLVSMADYAEMADAKAEHAAEMGWLHAAENHGWQEAWADEMRDAGLRY